MSSGLSPDDLAAIQIHKIDRDADVMEAFIAAVKWGVIAGAAYLCVDVLAGKTTLATLFVQFFATVEQGGVSEWWMYGAFLCFAWALAEHKLRLYEVGRMSRRLGTLEALMDKVRASSGSPRTGETPDMGKQQGD
jgi:hypothetical protein